MAGHVDHIVHSPENAVIAIGRKHRAVGRVIRPVTPVFAVRVAIILFVVLVDEPFRIAPDGLHNSRPWIPNTNVAGISGAGRDFFSIFVPNYGVDSERGRSGAARLHGIESRLSGAKKPTGFCLPPRIDNDRFALTNYFVVPLPHFRLDRLADGRHVLEVIGVFLWLVRPSPAPHSDSS